MLASFLVLLPLLATGAAAVAGSDAQSPVVVGHQTGKSTTSGDTIRPAAASIRVNAGAASRSHHRQLQRRAGLQEQAQLLRGHAAAAAKADQQFGATAATAATTATAQGAATATAAADDLSWQEMLPPTDKHAYLAACSIFKNEHGNVREWIRYHRCVWHVTWEHARVDLVSHTCMWSVS